MHACTWKMHFNPPKCQFIRFSNKQNIITYVAIYYQIHSEILKRLLDLNILVLILITTSHGKNNYCVKVTGKMRIIFSGVIIVLAYESTTTLFLFVVSISDEYKYKRLV